MKLSALLARRQALQRELHLANLAFAHERLAEFVMRIDRAGLRGPVVLKRADPDSGRDWPVLHALHGSQAVIDEHFTEEDIIDLADVIAYALDARDPEIVFDLIELPSLFQVPVRRALEDAGVQIDPPLLPPALSDTASDNLHSSACDEDDEL